MTYNQYDVVVVPFPFSDNSTIESIIRMKKFTLDVSLIKRKIGSISEIDQASLCLNLEKLFG